MAGITQAHEVDLLAESSARSQGPLAPQVTSFRQLLTPPVDAPGRDPRGVRLYMLRERASGQAVGMLKVEYKSLFLTDGQTPPHHPRFTLCVLDFHVHGPRQGRGLGLFLLESMIAAEADASPDGEVDAGQLAYDRPSGSLLSFLRKHFAFCHPIEQPTKFTVFPSIFGIAPRAAASAPYGAAAAAQSSQRPGQGDIWRNPQWPVLRP